MFDKKLEGKIKWIEERLGSLENSNLVIENNIDSRNKIFELEKSIMSIANQPKPSTDTQDVKSWVEERLTVFHKEITDKCLDSMQNILRYSREVALVETLTGQLKDKELDTLRTTLMKPVIEARNKEEKDKLSQEITEKVKSVGDKILEKRDALQQEYLEKNRKKLDTKSIEIELATLNWIIENK